jgi:hypothetical protein
MWMDIKDFNLKEEHKILTNSGSKGCQLKYYLDGIWFKVNTTGYEGLAEVMCSLILSCSNYPDFITYELCHVNGRPGCFSENFLEKEEELLSFERVHFINTGKSLTAATMLLDSAAAKFSYVTDFFQNVIDLDVTSYLRAIISMDFLSRNGDRHYNNLAVIKSPDGYRTAPIFDNGDAFFSNFSKYDPWLSIPECIEKSVAMPFSGSFEQQFHLIKNTLKINYEKLFPLLDTISDCRCKEAALALLQRYETIFRDDDI